MDQEFMESILVPQIMPYGFLGCSARADGLHLSPQLPADWPELTVKSIHYGDHMFDVMTNTDSLRLTTRIAGSKPIPIWLKPSQWEMKTIDSVGIVIQTIESLDTVAPLVLNPVDGQTYIFKDKSKP